MSLVYSRLGTNDINGEAIQIARDGQVTIYYKDESFSYLDEHDPEEAEIVTTEIVDDVAERLGMTHLSTKDLISLDTDVLVQCTPSNRYLKKIYAKVRDELASREGKLYQSRDILRILPRNIPDQRDALFISGSSGQGKTTFASKYAQEYTSYNPGNRVFIISRKRYDPVLDDVIPDIIRPVLDRTFIRQCLRPEDGQRDPIEDYRDSLVIFDDFTGVANPSLLKAIENLKNAILELGRQHNIYCICIHHKTLGGKSTKVELTEATHLVVFPRGGKAEARHLLERYMYYSKADIDRILDKDTMLKDRWICIIRPNIIISERYIKILDI